MATNWSKILLFSLLFGAVGFLLGRVCGHGCGPKGGGCGADGPGRMHGGHHGRDHGCDHGCRRMDDRCEQDVQGVVEGLRAAGFQGDTTVHMGCCTVKVGLHGDKTQVEVEKRDSVRVVEKAVEEHH